MKTSLITLFALASSASATFDWLDAGKFTSPDNCDNKCVEKQKSGFVWDDLNLGKFTKYHDFDFEGFTCEDDGKTKRDLLTGRTFQSKHIKGVATDDRSKASCFGSSKEKFSVKDFTVSTDYDTDLEFEYDMPDGSICKQKQACKKSGTIVKNTQCGGAKKVKVCLPKKKTTPKKPCGFKFHDIKFDCKPPKTPPTPPTIPSVPVVVVPTPTPTPSEVVPSSTPSPESETETLPVTEPAVSTTTDALPVTTTSAPESEIETIPVTQPGASTTTESLPVTSDVPPFPQNGTTTEPPSVPETTPAPGTTIFTTDVVTEIRTNTITSCGPEVISCPAESTVVTTETAITSTVVAVTTTLPPAPGTTEIIVDHTTVIIETSVTTCPVTSTRVEDGTTVVETGVSTSTEFITQTSTICTKCTAVPVTDVTPPVATETESQSPVTTTSSGPAPPAQTADCPAVLPKCINTWVEISKCKSNADADCFCKSNDLVEKIYQCLSAHGASDEEVDKAQNFFQGVCAPYVPENPAIITDATTLTITASHPVQTAPVTTIQLITTVTVPCVETEGPSQGATIPGSSTTKVISTAVTVPQVVFETITGASSHIVSLVQGTPTAPANNVPATTQDAIITTTPFIGVPTTLASIGLPPKGTGAFTPSPPQFTGAASRSSMNIVGVMGAGIVAALML